MSLESDISALTARVADLEAQLERRRSGKHLEVEQVRSVLESSSSVSEAAGRLGICRRTLYKKAYKIALCRELRECAERGISLRLAANEKMRRKAI
jgi:ActR/RegA family two-component response regulator